MKTLLRKALRRAGLEVRRARSQCPSGVFEEFYEALFERNHRIVFKFPIHQCVDKLGFSYGSWQPWAETVRQFDSGKPLHFSDSILNTFYRTWTFPLINDVFEESIPDGKLKRHLLKVFHGSFMPFSPRLNANLLDALQQSSLYLASENRHAGSDLTLDQSLDDDGAWTEAKGQVELKRLSALHDTIKKIGYVRDDSPDGDIGGYLLRRDDSFRFVITAGLHRASVLSALNHKKLIVRLDFHSIIDLVSIDHWPLVREGVWPKHLAARYFHHLFDFDSLKWAHSNFLTNRDEGK